MNISIKIIDLVLLRIIHPLKRDHKEFFQPKLLILVVSSINLVRPQIPPRVSATGVRPPGPPPALPPRQLSAAADVGAVHRWARGRGEASYSKLPAVRYKDIDAAHGDHDAACRRGAAGPGRGEAAPGEAARGEAARGEATRGEGPRGEGSRGEAGGRRAPPQRQSSMSAPFASTNPFTSPRHAEFVIPQRNNLRRSSTTDRT